MRSIAFRELTGLKGLMRFRMRITQISPVCLVATAAREAMRLSVEPRYEPWSKLLQVGSP